MIMMKSRMWDGGTTTTAICYKFYTVFKRRGDFYTGAGDGACEEEIAEGRCEVELNNANIKYISGYFYGRN